MSERLAEKIKVDGVLIVEGKYDKIKLSSLVDGLILQTDGFRIFKDPEKRAMIRRLGERERLIILTDSDVAGMKIRNYLGAIAPQATIQHLYIPQIAGKERRKSKGSKEGTLGVEGMTATLLQELLTGATVPPKELEDPITKADLYRDGYIGLPESTKRRQALLAQMGLPGNLSTKAMLRMINTLMTKTEYEQACQSVGLNAGEVDH